MVKLLDTQEKVELANKFDTLRPPAKYRQYDSYHETSFPDQFYIEIASIEAMENLEPVNEKINNQANPY